MASYWALSLALGLLSAQASAGAGGRPISAAERAAGLPSGALAGPIAMGHGHSGHGHHHQPHCGWPPFAVGPVPYGFYLLPPVVVGGGIYPVYPPPVGFGPSMVPLASPDPGFGVAGPPPPRAWREGDRAEARPAKPAKRSDPDRVEQLTTLGDRLFRAGNSRRAEERYEQAARADPGAAAPRIGLAQVALGRGDYSEAAEHVRDAVTADPGWLIHAPDVAGIYGEPADFHEQVARLETHLQVRPTDRDAWLVLGAQWYLSGQTRKAADAFLRLTDRKADPALEAFLDATAAKNQGD